MLLLHLGRVQSVARLHLNLLPHWYPPLKHLLLHWLAQTFHLILLNHLVRLYHFAMYYYRLWHFLDLLMLLQYLLGIQLVQLVLKLRPLQRLDCLSVPRFLLLITISLFLCWLLLFVTIILVVIHLHKELVSGLPDHSRQLGSGYVMHPLVVDQHLGRQPFQDPYVTERIVGSQSGVRVPVQTTLHKIQEVHIFLSHQQGQRFAARLPKFAPAVFQHYRFEPPVWIVLFEELMSSLRLVIHFLVRHSYHLYDTGHLIVFTFARENRVSDEKLSHYATERPHVDGAGVLNA